MKKKLFLLYFLAAAFLANSQNVGIGTTVPKARLHVVDSSVLFSASSDIPPTPGVPPEENSGRRMMWYPDKAAFRVGYVNGDQWNQTNIGNYSFAAGSSTNASGSYSTAIGFGANANGIASIAMGRETIANGDYSTASGFGSLASGFISTSMGTYTTASGGYSTAIGNSSIASGDYSIAIGENINARSTYETVLGRWNTDYTPSGSTTDRLFSIGNGTGAITRSDALTVLKNGKVGIGAINPAARLHVTDGSVLFSASGNVPPTPGIPPEENSGRRMMWYPDKAAFRAGYVQSTNWDKNNIGQYSVAFGNNTQASGRMSLATGYSTHATGEAATAMGYSTSASGYYSTAIGYVTNASGFYSTTTGYFTSASGDASTAMGFYSTAPGAISTALGYNGAANSDYSVVIGESVTANSWSSTSLGRYNDPIVASPTTGWVLTEPLLIVGNGTDLALKKNALVILKNGKTGIGINNPSNPLSFPATLEKKISLYPGATGDVGFAVQGNQLLIYADHPGAMVRLGYDQAGVFTNNLDVYGNGDAWLRGTLTQNSDARLKKEIYPLQNSLQKIVQLNGYNYYWQNKNSDSSLQTGVIAQEVQKLFPQLVKEDNEGMLSVNYSGLIPVLIESIKEQQHLIEKQQQQIDELKKLVEKSLKQ